MHTSARLDVVRTLVVDVFAPWRQSVCFMLHRHDEFQLVGEVSDGLEAVQKAEELKPDLILLDIGLPHLNGIEAAKRIRQVVPATKILFLTVDSDADVVQAALDTGAKGYVLKPDAGSELWTAIEAVLQGKEFVSSGLVGRASRIQHKQDRPLLEGGVPMHNTVLVVDDEATIRLSLSAIFEENGFQVQKASSALDAIRSVASASFDLVITDLKMETETAGFDVAEFAAKQNPRPVVIMISAYPALGANWKRRGVDAFFEKPTNISMVLRSINELLARRHGAAAA
jgi:DNA-binding NarL/FixJ family response regulator